ncbi:MAG: NAD-dependent epimerase/dehydratase family protein [Pseudomonadota bacterium]
MGDLQAKEILVTGANGFIGAHLIAELLRHGAHVTGIVRPTSDCWRFDALGISPKRLVCDLADQTRLEQLLGTLDFDVVFHLAAERDHQKLMQAEAEGRHACAGDNVMRAVASAPRLARFVSLGSSLEVPDRETNQPVGPHGKSKFRELQAMRALASTLDIPFSPTRTHYVYGPLQTQTKLVPVAIRAAHTGDPISLTGPDIRKRYVYVLDVVAALLHVQDQSPPTDEVQLITSAQQISNLDVVRHISDLARKPLDIAMQDFAARDFDRGDWTLSGAGTPLAGWHAKTPLVDGLRACLDWETAARA